MNRRSFISGLLAATALRAPNLPAALELNEASLMDAWIEIGRAAGARGIPIVLRPTALIFPAGTAQAIIDRGVALISSSHP